MIRERKDIINDIKKMITAKGYFYSLCMILCEDFSVSPEKLNEVDWRERLSVNEVSFLLGLMVKKKIDYAPPDSFSKLLQMKQQTYKLFEELHESLTSPFVDKIHNHLNNKTKDINIPNHKEFLRDGKLLLEPIFYSGTGAYDVQYLDFLARKYKYDKSWLHKQKKFDIDVTIDIVLKIKKILNKKLSKIQLIWPKERLPEITSKMKEKDPEKDWDKILKEKLPEVELHQYINLFSESERNEENLMLEDSGEIFYMNLMELFVIRESDFDDKLDTRSFFNNFSISIKPGLNSQFDTIGNYNIINSHPILKIDEERYFIPVAYLLFQAIYESPFYWMMQDTGYKDEAGDNRGKVGEEIVYDFLSSVFGESNTFKSLKIYTEKKQEDTDIDVLCVIGSKALSVQVKSKKLTELSRIGDDNQLKNDFKGAVQDAFKQGLVSRDKIIGMRSKFINNQG